MFPDEEMSRRHLLADHRDSHPDSSLAATPSASSGQDSGHITAILDVLMKIGEGIERLNIAMSGKNGLFAHDGSACWSSIARDIGRIANKLDPPPGDIVDSNEVASRLGCTNTWIAEMARKGAIPTSSVVPGSGNGKPWKFYRQKIDAWIASRS